MSTWSYETFLGCFLGVFVLFSPTVLAEKTNLKDFRSLVETLTVLIKTGYVEDALALANHKVTGEIAGVRETIGVPVELTSLDVKKVLHAKDMNRLLYTRSYFPFSPFGGYFNGMAWKIANKADFSFTTNKNLIIPKGIEMNSTTRLIPDDKLAELNKLLALIAFEEIYHAYDFKTFLATGLSASSIMNQLHTDLNKIYLFTQTNGERAVFLTAFYEYELFETPELARSFLGFQRDDRAALQKKSELGQAAAKAASKVKEKNTNPLRVSPEIAERVGRNLPLVSTHPTTRCDLLFRQL